MCVVGVLLGQGLNGTGEGPRKRRSCARGYLAGRKNIERERCQMRDEEQGSWSSKYKERASLLLFALRGAVIVAALFFVGCCTGQYSIIRITR